MSPSESQNTRHHAHQLSAASLEKCSGASRSWLARAIITNWRLFSTYVAHPRTTTCQGLDNFPERRQSSLGHDPVTSAIASQSKSTQFCLQFWGNAASDAVIDTDKVLSPSSENSSGSTGRGASMRSTHLSIHTCTRHRFRHNLASCRRWRKVTSLIEESSTIARRHFLPLQRAGLSDADRSRMTVLETPVLTATMVTVAATA